MAFSLKQLFSIVRGVSSDVAPPLVAPARRIAVFAYYALSFVSVLLKTMVLSGPKITKKYGEWAVVTGATDGVGRAMCFELARKGCRSARAACAPPATVLTAAWTVAALRSVLLVSQAFSLK